MKIRFISRKFDLTGDIRERVQKKLKKLDKFFPEDTEATVALYEEKTGERIEVTIYKNGTLFRAEESDRDIAGALDKAMDVIERQIRKNRTRLEKKHNINRDIFTLDDLSYEEEDIRITKVKHFDITPMTAEEAIMQMNLLSHSFFIFEDSSTGDVSVVYRRRENDYGVIIPN